MSTQGYTDAAAYCGADHTLSTLFGSRIDQVWVHDSVAPRLLAYFYADLSALPAPMSDKQALSDHFPIGVDFHPSPAHTN